MDPRLRRRRRGKWPNAQRDAPSLREYRVAEPRREGAGLGAWPKRRLTAWDLSNPVRPCMACVGSRRGVSCRPRQLQLRSPTHLLSLVRELRRELLHSLPLDLFLRAPLIVSPCSSLLGLLGLLRHGSGEGLGRGCGGCWWSFVARDGSFCGKGCFVKGRTPARCCSQLKVGHSRLKRRRFRPAFTASRSQRKSPVAS